MRHLGVSREVVSRESRELERGNNKEPRDIRSIVLAITLLVMLDLHASLS